MRRIRLSPRGGELHIDYVDVTAKCATQCLTDGRLCKNSHFGFRLVPLDQTDLRHGENEGEGQDAEHLEVDPRAFGEIAPHDLVENSHRYKEHHPAQRQLAPPLLGEIERLAEQQLEERS